MGEEIFIDANIFLEIILDDTNADICENFLKSLKERNKTAVTTDFIVYGCLVITERKSKSLESVKKAFMLFSSYSNLSILRLNFDDIYSAFEIMKTNKLDFDDSLVVVCMKNYGITELASLDRHFDKIKSIKRTRL